MQPAEIIATKRDGGALDAAQIGAFVRGYVAGDVPDYQAAAWCMATYFRGMTPRETTSLTEAMAFSGAVLDLHEPLLVFLSAQVVVVRSLAEMV